MDYSLILNKCKSIIDYDLPFYSNLANVASILKNIENINWCGFYIVKNNTLFLGPFYGEPACTKIEIGKGVCGTSFLKKDTIIVDNVNEFKGHIACSNISKSEIVVPVLDTNNSCLAVIDLDAPIYSRFGQKEKELLENIVLILVECFHE